jgi:hypothetical protein
METTTTLGLYEALLGAGWHGLAEPLRRLHTPGVVVRAAGTFRVRRGTNRLARLLAWLARLPTECDSIDLQLVVTPIADEEEWRRHFGGRPFVTMQAARDGLLIERSGLSEVRLQLSVVDGALRYQSMRAALCVAFVRLPLPRWMSPRVQASETEVAGVVSVSVEVCLPLLGRLIAYEGTLTSIEAKPC